MAYYSKRLKTTTRLRTNITVRKVNQRKTIMYFLDTSNKYIQNTLNFLAHKAVTMLFTMLQRFRDGQQ